MPDPSQNDGVIVRRASGVLFATLNIPATRNALAPEVVAALAATVEQAESDPEVRALVLRGAGGIFSAGGNVGNFQARMQADASQEDPVATRNRQFGYFMERLSALPVPVIAAVDGAAMGGGMGLACAADIVLATRDARFALSETTLGIIAAQIAPFVVQRLGAVTTRRSASPASASAASPRWHRPRRPARRRQRRTRRADRRMADAHRPLRPARQSHVQDAGGPMRARASVAAARRGIAPVCAVHAARGAEGVAAFREKRDAAWVARFDADTVRAAQAVA